VTPKRIQILSQNMIKKGAVILPSYMFSWNFQKFGDVFVVTSRKMPYDVSFFFSKRPKISSFVVFIGKSSCDISS